MLVGVPVGLVVGGADVGLVVGAEVGGAEVGGALVPGLGNFLRHGSIARGK